MPPALQTAGPGPVAAVHRILIGSALACALLYGCWEVSQWTETSEGMALGRAALAFAVAIGIGVYLRSLRGLAAKLTPHSRG